MLYSVLEGSPLSRLKLVMSVDVCSSSLDSPSLCSALLPLCSRACLRRVLFRYNVLNETTACYEVIRIFLFLNRM